MLDKMDRGAGIWPIESHATEEEADASADRLNLVEDERCAAINDDRAVKRKAEFPRGLFDSYFARRVDNPRAPL